MGKCPTIIDTEGNLVSKVSKDKENNERNRWLSSVEEENLLEESPQWLKEIILFDLRTRLRQNEILSLTWDRVDLLSKVIVIQETKNGKPRTIPLNQTALNILIEKSKVINLKTGLVFPNGKGKKIIYNVLIVPFNKAKQKAKIEDFCFHGMRHTFATRLTQRGYDIYKISKLLGHKDIRMTQRYAHHRPESLKDGIQMLDSDYNLTTVRENKFVSNA